MNQKKIDNILIIRLDGGEIAEEFVQSFLSNEIETIDYKQLVRCEHPHCAFFKTTHPHGDEIFQRTVLYTPEGRLHRDYKKTDEDVLVAVDRFVKNI